MSASCKNASISRRRIFQSVAASGVLAGCAAAQSANPQGGDTHGIRFLQAQTQWSPEPDAPTGMRTEQAPLSPARLLYWDCGGAGEPVVLMHAYTGSAETWAYQRDALVRSGYRAIGYSRRGHLGSERGPANDPGETVADLHALVDHLGLDRFHLVGVAAGGFGVTDYAISHPERVRSITLASTLSGIDEEEFLALSRTLTPPEFYALPSEMKEVGPSYRAANPSGLARWIELEQRARVGERLTQRKANRISWDALRALPMPALVMTGDADLYLPPSLLRLIKQRLPHWRAAIIAEAGHAAYWEQYEAVNATLIDFLNGVSARD